MAACASVAQSWVEVAASVPTTAAVWDHVRHRLLLVGVDSQQRCYEWDGSVARERLGELAGQRTVLHLTQDRSRGVVLALAEGGWVGSWDGGAWSWTNGGTPPPAGQYSVAFDELRRRLVVVPPAGGVHEWNGQQWSAVGNNTPAGVYPGGAFAFDPVSQRCVLYGGAMGVPSSTWSWDGFAWTLLAANSAPGSRGRAGLALDPQRNRLILYGGNTTATDTWMWSGSNWTLVPTASDPGPQRNLHLTSAGTGLVLVGTSGASAGRLWRLAGNVWQPAGGLPPLPVTASGSMFAWDPVRANLVSYNGGTTLVFDRRWVPVQPTVEPPSRVQPMVAWSSLGQHVLMFGGSQLVPFGDTWTWNGSDWQARQPSQSPAPRFGATMAEDPRGGVVLFGGTDGPNVFGDQWYWDGTDWQSELPPTLPQPRAYAPAATDPIRAQAVMWGGLGPAMVFSETWLWNGTTWSLAAPTLLPVGGVTATYRPSSGRVLLLGDRGAYEWNGTDWLAQGIGLPVPVQSQARLAANRATGQLLLHGGSSMRVWTHILAGSAGYGAACAVGRAPALAAIDRPVPGAAFVLELTARIANAPVFFVLGLAAGNEAIGSGCRSLVDLQVATQLLVADGGGIARQPVQIPNDLALRGVQFAAQAAVWHPAASPLGSVTLTSGRLMTIGD
ncbi:MAG: hypothetical protein JNK49_11405 [Planctomycetes bacterium]|nr:hypothetical protein [Planctomycetota bacterium]